METPTRRKEVQQKLLDILAGLTGLPIGLYELHDGELVGVFSDISLAMFEKHCQLIQRFKGGKKECETSQCNRAKLILNAAQEELTLCHAGMYNQAVPIQIKGAVRAVLLFGEMQIIGDTYEQKALEQHHRAVAQLDLSGEQELELRQLLLAAKRYTPEQLEKIKVHVLEAAQWYYLLTDEEDLVASSIERVTHDLQTQVQAVMAAAEILALKLPTLPMEDAQERASNVLYAAKRLDAVVQNMDDYLGVYQFNKWSIFPLLMEAKQLYEPEASRRDITITIRLGMNDQVVASRKHLQYALNNLIHNAVKYSFGSGLDHHRRIRVTGYGERQFYKIVIENYGIGILAEEIENEMIFAEGYQGKLTYKEHRTGGGRGLYFVKRVIDRHHGRIEVESKLMANEDNPSGQPHLNRFAIYLPYEQLEEN